MLSIILPSIRTEKLNKFYWSIVDSCHQDFELIIVSPYKPPDELYARKNIEWIQSWRSPSACEQEGLIKSKGDYVIIGADDALFLPNAIDNSMKLIEDYKTVVISRYHEGDNPIGMDDPKYWTLGYHKPFRLTAVPQDCFIFTDGPISKRFLLDLGGFDCDYETPALSHADLGIRAYKAGAKFILGPFMMNIEHQPGKTGDHAPIHNAHNKRDLPKFREIYSGKYTPPIYINLNNWKRTPAHWKERFK